MIASRGPVAIFSAVRSRPHASMMVRASLMTPAGVMSVHPQPLPEGPEGEDGSEGGSAGGQAGDGVDGGAEGDLGGPTEFAVTGGVGGGVTHVGGCFQMVRTMTMDPAGAVV